MMLTSILACALSLNGSWDFRFEEGRPLEQAVKPDFAATASMPVPACYDMMPEWYMKRGTGLYRRSFTLSSPMKDAVLVVDGMGVRGKFVIDGRDLGTHPYPYARLEIPVGALAAGEHTLFAAIDNILSWPRVKLARPYYDFYFYGGFYHGVKLVEREPKVFVRTLDYKTGKVELEVEGAGDSSAKIAFDGGEAAEVKFSRNRAALNVPDFRLWSPETPALHNVSIRLTSHGSELMARFGIRQIEAKNRKLYLNGRELFLKGFNRHESDWLNGAATGETLMMQDIQRLKSLGGNFIRGAHYQQCGRFLDLCDENGVLVWEESLGWGNGQNYVNNNFPPNELKDPEFCEMQIKQTRDMVRASFNHPSVIIYGFLNEPASQKPECKVIIDRLIDTIRSENSGRLVSFACNITEKDICCTNVDIVAFNSYPGTIPMAPGDKAAFAKTVADAFNGITAKFRERYPQKPIMVSESGCGGEFGRRGEYASPNTEEFQNEYLANIFETLWSNPDIVGFAIWQMNDGRTRERFGGKAVSAMFGGSIAGVFDRLRRPKISAETVRRYFRLKGGDGQDR
jgi:beta-glucuronidase